MPNRTAPLVALVLLAAVAAQALAADRQPRSRRARRAAAEQQVPKAPPIDLSSYRPIVVLNEMKAQQAGATATVSGVVFSRAPLERVSAADRQAALRPAELRELERLLRVPEDAIDAPIRTYFEIREVVLPRPGAHDVEITAIDQAGRVSDAHRITLVRAAAPAPAPTDATARAGAPR